MKFDIRKIVREVITEEIGRDGGVHIFEKSFGDMEFIKWVRSGALYRKSSGVMVKVTRDKSEYDNALRFIKKPHKSFINYYDAVPWNIINGDEYFVLEMEEVELLSDSETEVVDIIQNSLGSQEYMLDDNRRWRFLNELKQNPEWYEDYGSYKDVANLVMELYSMYKEAERRGFVLYDLRSINLGKNKEGKLVHFDIGDEY